MKVTLIAATQEQARRAVVQLRLTQHTRGMRVLTKPADMLGISSQPGEIFILVQAPRLALTWQARKDWQQVLDNLRERQLPLLEYTLP